MIISEEKLVSLLETYILFRWIKPNPSEHVYKMYSSFNESWIARSFYGTCILKKEGCYRERVVRYYISYGYEDHEISGIWRINNYEDHDIVETEMDSELVEFIGHILIEYAPTDLNTQNF